MKRIRELLSLGLGSGLVLGLSLHCDGAVPVPGPAAECTADSDCVLECRKEMCCTSGCPCSQAMSRAKRDEDGRKSPCAEMKVECRPTPREECNWSTHYRATCKSGSCVAEALSSEATAKLALPDTPKTIAKDDPRAAKCFASGFGGCWYFESAPCDEDRQCSIATPCDPASCEQPKR